MYLWDLTGIISVFGVFLVLPLILALLFTWALKKFPMARKIAIAIFAVYILGLGGFMAYRHTVPRHFSRHAQWMYWAYNLEELEKHADIIVEVTALKSVGKDTDNWTGKWYNAATWGVTYTNVQVEKVHYGDILPGTVITVLEPYVLTRGLEGLWLVAGEIYLPMKPAQSYLLFLSGPREDRYSVVSVHMGKHVIHHEVPQENEITPELLQVHSPKREFPQTGELLQYVDTHLQVIAKYMDIE